MSNKFQLSTLILLFFAAGCMQKKGAQSMPPLEVRIATVIADSLYDKTTFSTSIESLYEVKIEPRINGYLATMPYKYGKPIEQGAVIFTIDPSLLATALYSAEAEQYSAEAQMIKAENNYNRALPLSNIGAISKSDMDEYRAALAAAKASMRAASESLRSAQLNMGYTIIKAPIDGIIAKTDANEGDYVGPGTLFTELTTISYIDTVMVDLAIPSSLYFKEMGANMSDGDLLSNITLQLTGGDIYPHKGEYYYTKRDASEGSSTVVVVAKFPNPERLLKPGMFCRVNADIGAMRRAILAPQVAISQMQGVSSVWVMKPDSCVSFRRIELGDKYGKEWIVTSGLTEGERVLTTAQLKMHEGSKVKPINRQ